MKTIKNKSIILLTTLAILVVNIVYPNIGNAAYTYEVTNLRETHTSTSINLLWSLPTDTNFSHVRIYRNDILVADNIVTSSFNNTNLTPSSGYSFRVVTVDKTGVESTGISFYASTTYQAKNYSAGLLDNEITYDNGGLNVTNPANYKDNDEITFANLKGTASKPNSYISIGFQYSVNIDKIFIEFSSEKRPTIVLYDESYNYLDEFVLENGINNIPLTSDVKHFEFYSNSGTKTTKLYELDFYGPTVSPSEEFNSGHLDKETWWSGGTKGTTDTEFVYDNNLGTYARMKGLTSVYNSSYQIYVFEKPQIIESVYLNFVAEDYPFLNMYDENYALLSAKYLSGTGIVFRTPIAGVKYVEFYGIKNQQQLDLNELEFYGPNSTPPSEVADLTTSKTTSTVTLNWQKPSNGDFSKIIIYRDGVKIADNLLGNTYTDTGLKDKTTYQYKITTVDTSNNESDGSTVSITTDSLIPSDVTNVKETHTQNSVKLDWNFPEDGNYSFVRVYRDGEIIGDNITDTSFSDTGLSRGKVYSYKVVTVNAHSESPGTSIVATTDGILSVSLASIKSFNQLVLSAETKEITTGFTSPLQFEDSTNSASGWNVTIQATAFSQIGGKGLSFPSGSLSLKKPTDILALNGTTSPEPAVVNEGPWIIDNGSSVKILSANTNEGMGEFSVSFPDDAFSLNIPSDRELVDNVNAPSGTVYESNVTVTIVAGP